MPVAARVNDLAGARTPIYANAWLRDGDGERRRVRSSIAEQFASAPVTTTIAQSPWENGA